MSTFKSYRPPLSRLLGVIQDQTYAGGDFPSSSLWSATCYDFSLLSVPASPKSLTGQYYFEMATTLRVLGVRKSFWYLGLCTARDLLISGEFSGTWQLRRYPFSLRSHPAKSLKIPPTRSKILNNNRYYISWLSFTLLISGDGDPPSPPGPTCVKNSPDSCVSGADPSALKILMRNSK